MMLKPIILEMLIRRSFWFIFVLNGFLMWFVLGSYEIQFSNTAAKLTNLVVGNGWNVRSYDDQGIPYSYLARLKKKVISPYYVVHAGLIYSQSIAPPVGYDWLWKEDISFGYWGEDPPIAPSTKDNFINTVEWIMERLEKDEFGNTHILYHFTYPYKGTSQGFLLAPWHSGLTDAVAIKLLLRAYVVTNDKRYLDEASHLYNSVLGPIEKGGSLIVDEAGNPWIEEYVARNNTNFPFVLNGMIYATLAVMEYEEFMKLGNRMGKKLIQGIKSRLQEFDAHYWTWYDLVGTLANIKYHRIHIALLNIMYQKTGELYFLETASRWKSYKRHFVERHFLEGHITVNSMVVLCLSVGMWLCSVVVIYLLYGFLTGFPQHANKVRTTQRGSV